MQNVEKRQGKEALRLWIQIEVKQSQQALDALISMEGLPARVRSALHGNKAGISGCESDYAIDKAIATWKLQIQGRLDTLTETLGRAVSSETVLATIAVAVIEHDDVEASSHGHSRL